MSMRFYGYSVDFTTPSGTTTFTSATGVDGQYRQAKIEYNPLSGAVKATFGDETIYNGTTSTGLTAQAVRVSNSMGSSYNAGTLFVDNLGSMHTSFMPGDANGDGAVNVSDLSLLAANYGTASGATWGMGDFTGDGAVNVSDLSLLAANYGTGSTSAISWADAYAQAFGAAADNTDETSDDSSDDAAGSVCSSLGLSLIAGLALMGLMIVKLEE
jgi:hypothetical protein